MGDSNFSSRVELSGIQYVLTDIEGTTTSIQFVYDVLFPYFKEHIQELEAQQNEEEVHNAFQETVRLANELDGVKIEGTEAIIETLLNWSREDKKITPLKSLQGILWRKGYELGEIKGHVFPDVSDALKNWKNQGLQLGVFSSGSVDAQKQLFGYSEAGDLTIYFSHYFDTVTGAKRDSKTYHKIAEVVNKSAENILFLSDIVEELQAAAEAGFQTIQLVRPGTIAIWPRIASTFTEISLVPKMH
jgi:enolase-phosphatase E1